MPELHADAKHERMGLPVFGVLRVVGIRKVGREFVRQF